MVPATNLRDEVEPAQPPYNQPLRWWRLISKGVGYQLADKTAEATPTEDVEARVGDADPLRGDRDALRTFAADEILVVAHRDDEADWLEEGTGATAQARFGLPVARVTVAEDGSLAESSS